MSKIILKFLSHFKFSLCHYQLFYPYSHSAFGHSLTGGTWLLTTPYCSPDMNYQVANPLFYWFLWRILLSCLKVPCISLINDPASDPVRSIVVNRDRVRPNLAHIWSSCSLQSRPSPFFIRKQTFRSPALKMLTPPPCDRARPLLLLIFTMKSTVSITSKLTSNF